MGRNKNGTRGSDSVTPLEVIRRRAADFEPVKDYALLPIVFAFVDFKDSIEPHLREHRPTRKFDATVFYSRRLDLSGEDDRELERLNTKAYEGAADAGGLVDYYQGELMKTGENDWVAPELNLPFTPNCMSVCVWESRRQALNGAALEAHKKAVKATARFFSHYAIRKYVIIPGSESNLPEAMQVNEYRLPAAA